MTDIKRYKIEDGFLDLGVKGGLFVRDEHHAAIVAAKDARIAELEECDRLQLKELYTRNGSIEMLHRKNTALIEGLQRYSMSPGQADQRKAESNAVRVALGFGADADDVAPCDLVDAIAALQEQVRALAAEKELARRDAAMGDPVAWQYRYNDGETGCWKTVGSEPECNPHASYEKRAIYTAAQPAGSPVLKQDVKNIIGLLSGNEWAEHCTKSELGRELEGEVTRLQDLRSQQQKVVELPEEAYAQNFGDLDVVVDLDEVLAALDAANVKWEVKK